MQKNKKTETETENSLISEMCVGLFVRHKSADDMVCMSSLPNFNNITTHVRLYQLWFVKDIKFN